MEYLYLDYFLYISQMADVTELIVLFVSYTKEVLLQNARRSRLFMNPDVQLVPAKAILLLSMLEKLGGRCLNVQENT